MSEATQKKRLELTAFDLKVIAAVTMLIDHIGYIFVRVPSWYYLCRYIGRLAFPIFCFLLVEGFTYTNNRKNYAIRLALCGVVSEFAFDLAFHGKLVDFSGQNVLWTLLIGYLVMCVIDRTGNLFLRVGSIVLGLVAAELIGSDYGALGVATILVFYLFYNRKWIQTGLIFILHALHNAVQMLAVFAMIPISLYQGKQGPRRYRYWFYLYYPGHLIVLYLIDRFLI